MFDPNYTYPPSEKLWNDIIPDETIDGGSAAITMNYFDAGYAIYSGTVFDGYDYAGLCGKMTAKTFYDTELATGKSPEDIFADLDEQEANEDEALKRALGGSFSGSDPTTWDSLVSVTTDNPTDVGATSGTLNGTIKVGPTSTDSYFHWGTSATLDTYTTSAATPTPVTDTTAVSLVLTELSACTTYYYRVVGVADPGSATESELLGLIVSFTTSCETTTTVAETTTTAAPTTAAPITAAPTTAAPTTTIDGFTARVEGVVWLDSNRNAKQDSNEPGLPGILVRLEQGPITTNAGGPGESRSIRFLQAGVTQTTFTDAFGAYSFPKVAPGSWTLVATLNTNQLDKTSDTGGINDWIVPVSVPVNGVGIGDFAAAGEKNLTGVLETATGEKITCGTADVRWSGIDGILDTDDDLIIKVKADKNGGFST